MFNKLTDKQLTLKVRFIENYVAADNAAIGAVFNPNANVTAKNISTLENELWSAEVIQLNRSLVYNKISEKFGKGLAEQYLQDIKNHVLYIHDETSLKPYCASITLYPFLLEGTKCLGGTSKAPKNLQSFCGSFVNLVYQVAAGFAGAVATVEYLMYFDYFAKKTYGRDYLRTNLKEIKQEMQGVIYALNQPAAARGGQSVFWNISLFDKYYFESLFGEFFFPGGVRPEWDTLKGLQAFFMEWFCEERKTELLTYPVLTAAYLLDEKTRIPKDAEFENLLSQKMEKGLSFFHYSSESADSLASCCRLRNELADNTFSYTLGAGGVSAGSFQVITINMNRLVQMQDEGGDSLTDVVKRVHKYLVAHKSIHEGMLEAGMLPAYTAGFIDLDRQFGTIGINGMLEAYEYAEATNVVITPTYKDYLKYNLQTIKRLNKEAYMLYGFRFNTEFVPAESLGVKNAKWDKEDGYMSPRNCYNSYFYPVESDMDILGRIDLHGGDVSQYLDGGAALHLNLAQLLPAESAKALIRLCAAKGVPYWTFNVLSTVCFECGHIDPNTLLACPKCGNKDVEYATRVIGYLKLISSFSKERQDEAMARFYMDMKGMKIK